MKKADWVRIIAGIVLLAGVLVMVGWIADIQILKSILPSWVTMKFTTAICFVMTGIILYFAAECKEGRREAGGLGEVLVAAATLIILLIMGLLLISNMFGIRTGIEDLFVKEAQSAVNTSTPGRPSTITMFAFIVIAAIGLMMLVGKECNESSRWIVGLHGLTVGALGSVAVLGYVFGVPWMYYSIPGFSTAMAAHTAMLFILIGMAFSVLGKKEK